jgi:hypothetical protein
LLVLTFKIFGFGKLCSPNEDFESPHKRLGKSF